ncbi:MULTISPECIES: class I SAM-dependent methyltransferase [Amycolatopsis]|uniref:Methyltransferase domain-containing protein n=1 Tax=Amycolatopsis dendrobii TaxID=2760662 RepID=A0A7W3W280_9PSEU|nr:MULTISPECIES: class I SAM-dependent methyltransferase [Amycolatopsis]MBB1157405.1 methyltransferase domain-containing protein [Amycolatopsis dendrobii]UKD59198.1 class I SAM-dependent methyltransferase [Amycolatopsis sp. FU40]
MIVANAALGFVGIAITAVSLAGIIDFAWFGVLLIVGGSGTAALMLHSSLRGKRRAREQQLDRLALRGDEVVLDLGCGSGLLLIGVAARLTTGRATGIDLWRTRDQAGSDRKTCLENAVRTGVADKIELVDGDMAKLPFPSGSFDLVTGCLSVHNLHPDSRRAECVSEAFRVLRPGGRLLLIDFSGTAQYARLAVEAGMTEVGRSGLLGGMFPPCRAVTATKPAQ